MASIYDLKPKFQGLLRPIVVRCAAEGITANQVTIAAICISGVNGCLIALHPTGAFPLLLLPLVLFVRMALNAIDGMLAREHNMQTKLGAVLNELGDVFSDTLLYLPLALVPGVSPILLVPIVLLAIIGEMSGVLMAQLGASRRYDGPFGKSDRAFFFGVLGLCIGIGIPTGFWVTVLLAAALILSVQTTRNRVRLGLEELAA